MRRFLRTSLVLVALVAGLVAPNSASALRTEAFTGTFRYDEHGSGATGGTADLLVPGRGYAVGSFSAVIPPELCPLALYGTGRLSGATLDGSFTFSVLAGVLTITIRTDWGETLTGRGTHVVTRPVGNACHVTNVEALVAGTVAG